MRYSKSAQLMRSTHHITDQSMATVMVHLFWMAACLYFALLFPMYPPLQLLPPIDTIYRGGDGASPSPPGASTLIYGGAVLPSSLSPITLAYGMASEGGGGGDDWEDEEDGFEQNDEDLVSFTHVEATTTTTAPPQQHEMPDSKDEAVKVSNTDSHPPIPAPTGVEELKTLPGYVQEAIAKSTRSEEAKGDMDDDEGIMHTTTTTTTIINPPVPIPLLTEAERRHTIQIATWLTKDALEVASPTLTIPPLNGNETIEGYLARQQARSLIRRQLMKRAVQAHPLGAAAIFGAGMSDMTDGKTAANKGEEAASLAFPIAPNHGPIYSPLPFIHIPPQGGVESVPTYTQSYSRIVYRKLPTQNDEATEQLIRAQLGDVVGVDVSLRINSESATRRVIVVNDDEAGGVRTVDVAGRAAGTIPVSYHTRHPGMGNEPVRPARSTVPLYHLEHEEDGSRPPPSSSLQDDEDDVRTQGEFYGSRWLQIPLLLRHRSGELLRERVINNHNQNNSTSTTVALNTSASINELVVASQKGIQAVLDSFLVLAATHSHPTMKEEVGNHRIVSASLSAVEDVVCGMGIGEERAAIVPSLLAFGIHGHPSLGIEPLEEGLVLTIKLKSIVRRHNQQLVEYSEAFPRGKAVSGITDNTNKKDESPINSQADEEKDGVVNTAQASLSELPIEEDDEDDAAATLAAMRKKRKQNKSGGKVTATTSKHTPPNSEDIGHDLGSTTDSVVFTNNRHKTVVERVDRRAEAARSKRAVGGGPMQFIRGPEDDTLDTGEVDGAAMGMRLGSGKRGQTLKHLLSLSETAADTQKPSATTNSARGRPSSSRRNGPASVEHGKFPAHTSSYQQHGYNVNRGAHAFYTQATEQKIFETFNFQQKTLLSESSKRSNAPKTTIDMVLLTGRNSDPLDVARLNRISEELYHHTTTNPTTSHLDRVLVGDLAQVGPIILGIHEGFGNASQLFTPSTTNKWHGGLVGGLESCCDALNREQYNPTSLTSTASCVGEHIPSDQLPQQVVSQYAHCAHSYPLSLLSNLARSTTQLHVEDGSEKTINAEYHPQPAALVDGVGEADSPSPFPLYPLDAYIRVPHGAADDQTEKAWRWSRKDIDKRILLGEGGKLVSFTTSAALRYHYTSQYGTASKLLNLTRTAVKDRISSSKSNIPPTPSPQIPNNWMDLSLVSGSHIFIVVKSEEEVSSSKAGLEKETSIEVFYVSNVPSSLQGWRRLTSWTEQWAAIMKSTINSSTTYRQAANRHEAAQEEATKKLSQDITAPRVVSPHIHDLKGTANKVWSNLVNSKRIQMSVQDSFFAVYDIQPVISYQNSTSVHISTPKTIKKPSTDTEGDGDVEGKTTTTSKGNTEDHPPPSLNNRREMKDVESGEYYMNVPYRGLPEGLSTLVDPALPPSPPYHRQWCSYRRLNDCNDLLYAWGKGAMSTSQLEQALLLDHRGQVQSRQHRERVKGMLAGTVNAGEDSQQLLFAHMCPQPFLLFLHSVSVSGKEAAIKELRYVYSEVVSKYPTLKALGWVPLEEDQDVKDAIEQAAEPIYGRSSTAATTQRITQYTPHGIFSLYSQQESGSRLASQDAEALQRVLTPRLREQFRERLADREVEYGYSMGIITEGMMQALGQPII